MCKCENVENVHNACNNSVVKFIANNLLTINSVYNENLKLGNFKKANYDMSVLIFVDHTDGQIKKASHEALSYGAKIAEQTGASAEAVVLGKVNEDLAALGTYGVKKVHQVQHDNLASFDSQVYTKLIAQVAEQTGAKIIIFSNNSSGKVTGTPGSRAAKSRTGFGCNRSAKDQWQFHGTKKCFFRKSFCRCIHQHGY